MLKLARILILMCLAAPMAAHADPAGQPAPDGEPTGLAHKPVIREDALELARLLNPPEPIIALAGRSFDQAFNKGLESEGGGEALEKEFPGLVEALRQATRDATLADLRGDMPAIHRRYARFIAEHFTSEETSELIGFYRSPTGAKIVQAKFSNIDLSGVVDRLADDPDAKLLTDDLKKMNEGVMPAIWKGMSADDIRAVVTFGLRPVARKLRSAAPAMAAIETEIANEPDPELDAAIEAATQRIYRQFGLTEPAEQ